MSYKGAVGYTTVTPRNLVENSHGGNTPNNSQSVGSTYKEVNSTGSQRYNQQKNSRFKYYNSDNSSKNVDSYNNNGGNNNNYNNSIKYQGHPSNIYRHTHTHTPTHTHTHTHTQN